MRSLVQVQDGPFGVGGIAQLVERLLCKQDVSGSSPLTSTIMGVPRFRQGTRNMTETCSDEQTTDAKPSDTAANNIVAFSRIMTREFSRRTELVTA